MSAAVQKFIRHWQNFDINRSDRLHPDDANRVDGEAFAIKHLPVPVIGDLHSATVVVLMLNPGYSAHDDQIERSSCFQAAIKRCIDQSFRRAQYPFFYLDPAFANHTGAGYWIGMHRPIAGVRQARKLRPLVEELTVSVPQLNRDRARTVAAQRIAVVQLLPYHSKTFIHRSMLEQVKSCKVARDLAHGLVNEGQKLVIALRAVTAWGFENCDSTERLVVYRPSQGASASLSLLSDGGKAALRRLTAEL